MIQLEISDDGFIGHQLRASVHEHGYGENVEQFLREVLCRALYDIGALSSSGCAQCTAVERVEWLLKHGLSAKSIVEQADEAIDKMLLLAEDQNSTEKKSDHR